MAYAAAYGIMIHLPSAGNFTCTVMNTPTTQAAGGTNLTIPHNDNNNTFTKFTVTSATAATPIVATIGSGHGIIVGDVVTVTGGTGDTGINGTWRVSAVASTTVTLENSATAGTYTASSATLTPMLTSKSLHSVLQVVARAILNDKAAGN
jgi:hypothetical protein